jgi:cell division protease FtsH
MMTALDRDAHVNAAPETVALVDAEVRRIADEAYQEVFVLLRDQRDRLDGLAEALLEYETLDADDAYAAAGLVRPIYEEPRTSVAVHEAVDEE